MTKTADDLQNVVEYLVTILVGQSVTLGWHLVPENTGAVLRRVLMGELTTQDAKQLITNDIGDNLRTMQLGARPEAEDAIEVGVEDVLIPGVDDEDTGPIGF